MTASYLARRPHRFIHSAVDELIVIGFLSDVQYGFAARTFQHSIHYAKFFLVVFSVCGVNVQHFVNFGV